jgi:N-acyl-D-amino-acid deacylase
MLPDFLIRGASVIDGGGRPPFTADVLVAGNRIVGIHRTRWSGRARRVLDADGLTAAPGFVDIHSHSDYHLLLAPQADSSLRQGVTLEIGGNCGYAAAPIWGDWRAERAEEYRSRYDLPCPWSTLSEYFVRLESAKPAINYGQLIGHNTLRGSATAGTAAPATAEELTAMADAARQAMREGALGLSTGLAYAPACYAETAELAHLAGVIREEGGFLAAHVRSEGDQLLEALSEVLTVAQVTGVPLHISHLKTMHERNWSKLDSALRSIEAARAAGADVTADRYPYTAANTGLEAVLPRWALEGSRAARLTRLTDPVFRNRLLHELASSSSNTWKRIVIAEVREAGNRRYEGLSVAEAAAACAEPPESFALDLLAANGGQVGAIYHAMSAQNLERILSQHWVMIASDSGCRAADDTIGAGLPHPRTFGTFVRVLGPVVRETRLFRLETAVRKMTADPCRRLGLVDRGQLAPGYVADIVLFDPVRVSDTATYEKPWGFPTGVHTVLVNGQLAVEDGIPTGLRAGRVVRSSRSSPRGAASG